MNLQNISITLFFALILIPGCNTKDKITLGGSYPEGSGKYLYINRVDVNTPVFIDSVKINKSGTFKARLSYDQPAFYNIGFDDFDFITVIAYPGDNINISFKGAKLYSEYKVEGSKESEDIRMLDLKLSETLASLDSLGALFDALPGDESADARRADIEKQYSELIQAQRMHNIGYIIENLNSFSSIKALFQRIDENAYVLYKPTDAQYLKLVSDTLNAHYPESKQARALAENLKKELAALNYSKITSLAEGVETSDLDLELKDRSGKSIRLSSFEGKSYVLLSFWSVRSKDCISNNLQMKEIYKSYHNKGFEIYQVNIDEDEDLWKRTVAFDELPWVSVRDDQASNASTVVRYNVTKVPTNYLIDKNGEIIGRDLFGRTLQIKLSQILD